MQLTDISVLQAAHSLLTQGKPYWLCTILHTYGSAPRPVGSLFITDGVTRYGSISGGCLEDAFVDMLASNTFERENQTFVYGKHAVDQDMFRELPCGGTIELLIEYVEVTEDNLQHFATCLSLGEQQKPMQRHIMLNSHSRNVMAIGEQQKQVAVSQVIKHDNAVILNYQEVFQLLIVGIGLVSEQVARLGLLSGFDVKVCDMRKELADTWHFDKQADGVDIHWMSPDVFVEQYATANTAVLALAHDPRLDDVALMEVFSTKAFYIGAMGSSRTTEKRLERLKRICEIDDADLARLHAPIGLNIGSKTPMEIAIAIMADIIRCRHQIDKSAL